MSEMVLEQQEKIDLTNCEREPIFDWRLAIGSILHRP